MFWLTKSSFLSLCLSIILTSTIGTAFSTPAKDKVSKSQYLDIALLQSSSDPDYVKPIQQWFIKIYTEALSRLGFTLRCQILPPKRASLYSNRGRLDGELSRVFDYNTKYPNLIRVEEHHLLSVFSAFAADSTITLNGWKSLTNTKYKVGYRRGIKKSVDTLATLIPSERLFEFNSINEGVGQFLIRKTNIFIDSEDGVFDYLKTDEFKRISQTKGGAVYKVGVMETVTSHFWLHKKHRDLAHRLSAILRDMKKEGIFDLYLEQIGLSSSSINW